MSTLTRASMAGSLGAVNGAPVTVKTLRIPGPRVFQATGRGIVRALAAWTTSPAMSGAGLRGVSTRTIIATTATSIDVARS